MGRAFQLRVFILRHGQTDANAGGVVQGSSNFSRLTELGKQQARDAYHGFFGNADDKNHHISSIYCSPLARARETLEQWRQIDAQQSKQVLPKDDLILEDLREIDFYDWEGKGRDEIEASFPESWNAWEEGNPYELKVLDTTNDSRGGEEPINAHRFPLLELWERADRVWDEIFRQEKQKQYAAEENRAALIVAHGSLGRALLGTAMGWQADKFREHEFPNCGIVELNYPSSKLRQKPASRWRWLWPTQSAEWNVADSLDTFLETDAER
eukprot:scaffold3719_cov104-Cylindrotheca_fusiformis.AAC.4